jgi:hypothetical protein
MFVYHRLDHVEPCFRTALVCPLPGIVSSVAQTVVSFVFCVPCDFATIHPGCTTDVVTVFVTTYLKLEEVKGRRT